MVQDTLITPSSVLPAYWRTRFDKNAFYPSRIVYAIAVQEPVKRTVAQRKVFASLCLYFAVVTAIVSWLEYDPSVGGPLLSRMVGSSVLTFAGVLLAVAYVLTCGIYAARWLRWSFQVLVLFAHAINLAVFLAGLDSCHAALHTMAMITGSMLMTVLLAPTIGDQFKNALAVALAAWAMPAIVRGILFAATPGETTIVQLAISLSVSLIVLLLLMYDAVYLFRYIQCGEVTHGVAYLLVDILSLVLILIWDLLTGVVYLFVCLASVASPETAVMVSPEDIDKAVTAFCCCTMPKWRMYQRPWADEETGKYCLARLPLDVICCWCCWCFNEELNDQDLKDATRETVIRATNGGRGKAAVVPVMDTKMER